LSVTLSGLRAAHHADFARVVRRVAKGPEGDLRWDRKRIFSSLRPNLCPRFPAPRNFLLTDLLSRAVLLTCFVHVVSRARGPAGPLACEHAQTTQCVEVEPSGAAKTLLGSCTQRLSVYARTVVLPSECHAVSYGSAAG